MGFLRSFIFSLGLAALLAACATAPEWQPPYAEPSAGQDREAVFQKRWAVYVDSLASRDLQPECQPRLVEPPASVEYRGTVVFLHGFTACPQQFFEMAELLALRGFRSVLPVLPGHGRQFVDPKGEAIDDLPVADNWESAYGLFAEQINGLMAFADGERVIGGLSAGGTATLFVNIRAPQIYDRTLLYAPFFAPGTNALAGSAVAVTTGTPGVREASVKPFGIKEPCLDKRADGRAGFCNYQLKHVAALNAMADSVRASLEATPLAVPLQFVGVENDSVANNAISRQYLDSRQGDGLTSACFFPDGVPHAMISGYDSPGIDMFWLDSLLSGSIGFITRGEPFPHTGQPSIPEDPYPICATTAERRD